jgi:transposase
MPPPASSSATGPSRGGGRQASSALWTIAITRLAPDPRTKAYLARRTAEGKTTKKIIRCLKRYIAREICKALCRPKQPGQDPAPQDKQDLPAPVFT